MEAVALFSFTALEPDELSFQKGDVIKVSVLKAVGVCVCVLFFKEVVVVGKRWHVDIKRIIVQVCL